MMIIESSPDDMETAAWVAANREAFIKLLDTSQDLLTATEKYVADNMELALRFLSDIGDEDEATPPGWLLAMVSQSSTALRSMANGLALTIVLGKAALASNQPIEEDLPS